MGRCGPKANARKDAEAAWQEFVKNLHSFRVLDPACGSGNFLNLALEALRDVERRVFREAKELAGYQQGLWLLTGPHNILGIEINEYAAELARTTVWIGDLQWRRRNGRPINNKPILSPLDGIEHRDALLEVDGSEAEWPPADVIVGNPPFLGGSMMRAALKDPYVEVLRSCYNGRVPGGADLVTYWFEKARTHIETGKAERAGLVATNSIRGGANRKVLERIAASTRIFNAWSDEP
jgi:type II restriction/modification system DNA methylase subunit YeeA